jgi:hypothetical protein
VGLKHIQEVQADRQPNLLAGVVQWFPEKLGDSRPDSDEPTGLEAKSIAVDERRSIQLAILDARVAKQADARDLKSRVPKGTYRFDSGPGHFALRPRLQRRSAAVSSRIGRWFPAALQRSPSSGFERYPALVPSGTWASGIASTGVIPST